MIDTAPRREARIARDLPPPPALDPATTAIFADLDGTLAEIEATPELVTPDSERRRLLDRLAHVLGGRLAVISGRGLADIDRVLEGRVPNVAAVHGLVRRTAAGRVIEEGNRAGVGAAVKAFEHLAQGDPGLLVEDKIAAAALHYRRSPSAAATCVALAWEMAAKGDLAVQSGDMVVEVRAKGPDKGVAVAAFMEESPFAGATPIFVGDDLTDEDGFRAVKAMGGHGVIVGDRRPTLADYALADVKAVKAWLRTFLEAKP